MTTLYQLQLDQSLVNCGMSYVFQLQNGRFFIIDGGYFTPGEAERLFAFLSARAEGTPHIAGWFFSHAHQDHVGAFINFIRAYAEAVPIDGFYYNFQPADFSSVAGGWMESDMATFREFYRATDAYAPGVPRHILHTGDVVQIEELTFEALFTHEDLPDRSSATFNDMSTVIRVSVAGQTILFLGDVYVEGSAFLLREKADKLACDIVQVSHHGFGGATTDVYRATGARVALWPTPAYVASRLDDREPNHYLLHQSQVREHFISGHGTAALPLPYLPGTAAIHNDAYLANTILQKAK